MLAIYQLLYQFCPIASGAAAVAADDFVLVDANVGQIGATFEDVAFDVQSTALR